MTGAAIAAAVLLALTTGCRQRDSGPSPQVHGVPDSAAPPRDHPPIAAPTPPKDPPMQPASDADVYLTQLGDPDEAMRARAATALHGMKHPQLDACLRTIASTST